MGLLDDAIREHLELKRRHGADEAEVERLEKEAFGPARTPGAAAPAEAPAPQPAPEPAEAPAPQPAPEPAPPAPDVPPEPAPEDPEPPHGDELVGLTEAPAQTVDPPPAIEPQPDASPEPPRAVEAAEAAPAVDPVADAGDPADASPFTVEEPWLEEPDEVPADEGLDHPRGQPTTEFSPEDLAAARGEERVGPGDEPAEDVLEETPEFLQETPEHDRLWFEQKPPKDFDFGN